MELIRITPENIEKEHICCAIANNKDIQVTSKKAWLSERMSEGLVFLKCNVRGKCFIEYIPAEFAWAPIDAPDFIYIDCLWVAGQFKGKGYSTLLLKECIREAKANGKKGLVILSSKKKRGFLADYSYLTHEGFEVADTCEPYFELMYLPFEKDAIKPQFSKHLKNNANKRHENGFTLYYTNQCPFTAKYVPLLHQVAKNKNVNLEIVPITSCKEAQNAPSPFTTFSLYYDNVFVTHEILSEAKFEKIILEYVH